MRGKRRLEPKLAAAIGVVDQIHDPGSMDERFAKRIERKLARDPIAHRKANDST